MIMIKLLSVYALEFCILHRSPDIAIDVFIINIDLSTRAPFSLERQPYVRITANTFKYIHSNT